MLRDTDAFRVSTTSKEIDFAETPPVSGLAFEIRQVVRSDSKPVCPTASNPYLGRFSLYYSSMSDSQSSNCLPRRRDHRRFDPDLKLGTVVYQRTEIVEGDKSIVYFLWTPRGLKPDPDSEAASHTEMSEFYYLSEYSAPSWYFGRCSFQYPIAYARSFSNWSTAMLTRNKWLRENEDKWNGRLWIRPTAECYLPWGMRYLKQDLPFNISTHIPVEGAYGPQSPIGSIWHSRSGHSGTSDATPTYQHDMGSLGDYTSGSAINHATRQVASHMDSSNFTNAPPLGTVYDALTSSSSPRSVFRAQRTRMDETFYPAYSSSSMASEGRNSSMNNPALNCCASTQDYGPIIAKGSHGHYSDGKPWGPRESHQRDCTVESCRSNVCILD
jgi:hypothetical protein